MTRDPDQKIALPESFLAVYVGDGGVEYGRRYDRLSGNCPLLSPQNTQKGGGTWGTLVALKMVKFKMGFGDKVGHFRGTSGDL